ncbi:cupin domain-containing protein [Paucibacter sp. DJ1R-11]|uniref:cupin domain-containing protein n=1 Tax=Paucibacter sp. DJ1R-11 TaxID=2893556 RepID=UPI0021E423D9|nr:cupin domain-containing protein [Paucibacter sp. DJ1R-11]MCV2362027.1 cupin domain-containing protein [Paucibacter sp. DJ1R-11]
MDAQVLITSAAMAALPVQHKTHLLNANAQRESRDLAAATGMSALGFQLLSVAPGREAWEYHRHLYEEQCVYILSGRGEAVIEERRHVIGPGDFLGFAARGAAHTLINTGEEPLVFIVARTNLEQDVCDYPRQGKRLYMSGAEEALVDLAQVSAGPLGS